MTLLFYLEGVDVDGSTVQALEVKEITDMPSVPRAGEILRAGAIFEPECVVWRVEYGRRSDQRWGATIYMRATASAASSTEEGTDA